MKSLLIYGFEKQAEFKKYRKSSLKVTITLFESRIILPLMYALNCMLHYRKFKLFNMAI